MGHMLAGPNVALHVCRQSISDYWGHVLAARGLVDDCYVSNKSRERGYTHPLYVYADQEGLALDRGPHPNFCAKFLKELATALGVEQTNPHGLPKCLTPEDILNCIYAVFHSPGYRHRYMEFLKIDFPRFPLPENLDLFRALARLGGELVALHLLESPKLDKPIAIYSGVPKPEIEKITYGNSTVWLDKAQTNGFRGVTEVVWNFRIGGYQVCEKWLKDRRGRSFSKGDIDHYQRIIVALAETIRIMTEIDKVIDAHGGWPGAFVTGESSPASTATL